MISEGLYLMLVGMSFVVSFLTLLVLILNIMEKVIGKAQLEIVADEPSPMDNSSLTAVISAAIHQHRNRKP